MLSNSVDLDEMLHYSLFARVHIYESLVYKGLKQGQHLKMLFSENFRVKKSGTFLAHLSQRLRGELLVYQ